MENKVPEQYTKNCISCRLPNDNEIESLRTIYEDQTVKAVLRVDNQVWLGRFVLFPKQHMSPNDLWKTPKLLSHMGIIFNKLCLTLQKAFDCKFVNMAQLGNLTENEFGEPTSDQNYQHVHFHGIPRYVEPPYFDGYCWKDPQYEIDPKTGNGKFLPLNLDIKLGLNVIKPTPEQIIKIVDILKSHLQLIDG